MTRELLRQIEILLRPIKTRLANSIARAVLTNIDDSTKIQLVQAGVLAGEDIEGAERFQEYGFTSVPHPGAEAVIVFPNGDRAHALVLGVDDRRYRPKNWEPGEVGMYTDEDGHLIRMRRGLETAITGTKIHLGEDGLPATDGVLNGTAIDSLTGATFHALGHASAKVFAKK